MQTWLQLAQSQYSIFNSDLLTRLIQEQEVILFHGADETALVSRLCLPSVLRLANLSVDIASIFASDLFLRA